MSTTTKPPPLAYESQNHMETTCPRLPIPRPSSMKIIPLPVKRNSPPKQVEHQNHCEPSFSSPQATHPTPTTKPPTTPEATELPEDFPVAKDDPIYPLAKLHFTPPPELSPSLVANRLQSSDTHRTPRNMNHVSLRIKQRSSGGIEDGNGFRLLEAQVSKFGKAQVNRVYASLLYGANPWRLGETV